MDIKVKLEAQTAQFDAALDEAAAKIIDMAKQMGATKGEIKKAFADLGKQSVRLGGKEAVDKFAKEIKAAVIYVDELKEELAEMKAAEGFDANSEAALELKEKLAAATDALSYTQAAYAAAQKEAEAFSVTVNGVVYSGENATKVQRQMARDLEVMANNGEGATDAYKALQAAAAKLKDTSLDVHKETQNLASDTAKLDAAMGGLQAAAGAYSVITGTLETFGLGSEDAAEAQKKLQAAISITTGLTAVSNQFQKQSSVIQGILAIQEKARAKANDLLAASQGKATIAQKAFNLVAKANPYVLLAMALVTVVGAITAFALGTSKANKKQAESAAQAKAWSEYLKTVTEQYQALGKKQQEVAKHAVDMAQAEGKAKREVLELQKQQLEVEKKLAAQASGFNAEEVKNLEANKKKRDELKLQLLEDKRLKGEEKKYKMRDDEGQVTRVIDDDSIKALEAQIEALDNYIEIGENVVEVNKQIEISAANLAEQTRQLAIEEANANTQARRTTEDMRAELMTDEKAKQRKQTAATYDRQIEDLKTRLANEKNLTVEQREEMNKQIILLDQQKKKALEDLRRQDLNDQYNAQKEVQAKMRDLTVERMEQETNDTLKALQEKAQVEKQARLDELEEQKQAWIKAQGGLKDSEGKYSDESKLTKEQKEYLQSAAKNINDIFGDGTKVLGSMIEKEIYEKYSSAFQRAVKDNKRFEDDIALMAGAGKDTSEAERQRNEQALAYMQDVEGGLTPEFKAWIDSLGDYTTKTLESMLASAEEQLTVLKAAGAPQEEIIAAEARIAALNKEVKEAQTDISRGPKLTAYKNLNKVLGDAASGFEALGQTGNEAFDSLMKEIADITSTVQSVIANIQTLVSASSEGMKQGAQEGAKAVKAVEKASVILAIIGAVLSLAIKVSNALGGEHDNLRAIQSEVNDLRNALRDLKREMALDVSGNKSIFGENQFKNLEQYTKATQDYATEYQKAVEKMSTAWIYTNAEREGGRAATMSAKERESRKKLGEAMLNAGFIQPAKDLQSAIGQMLDSTMIKTQHKTWFRKEQSDSLRNLLGDVQLLGETEEETMANLKKFTESDLFGRMSDEQQDAINNMIADWETYNQALEGVKSTFSNFFGEMNNSFAESIKTGFTDGAKAGRQNFKEQVNGMVSDFYLQMRLGERTAQMESDYTERMTKASGNTKEQQDIALAYANELSKMYDEELAAYEALQTDLENRGYGLKDALDGTLSGAIKGASQESIDLLSGYCNAVRIQQVDGINIMREQLISLSGIEGNTRAINVGLQGFRTSMENILRTDGARAVGAN